MTAGIFHFPFSIFHSNGLAVENVMGDIKLHLPTWYDNESNWHDVETLLDAATRTERYFSMREWRALLARYHATRELEFMLTSASTGHADLVVEYATTNGNHHIHDSARQRVTSILPPLRFDITRDGAIDSDDVREIIRGQTFYYWFNEDRIKDDYVGQNDNDDLNSSDLVVNGTFDLVNLFAVAVDVRRFVNRWENRVRYVVRPEYWRSDAFNFCLADVAWMKAGTIQTTNTVTLAGDPLSSAPLASLPSSGAELSYSDLNSFSNDTGVLVCEAKARDVSLCIEIRDGDDLLYSYHAPMTILPVKEMYSWYNFRNLSGDEVKRESVQHRLPDEQNTKTLIFLHGANVNEDEAEVWGDVIFKRTWLAGCRADFCNVDWRSNIGSAANYHANASNAFVVASQIASTINAIPGEKVIMAHSLGNMVVSSMIQDYGLQVSKYLMCDSAVPAEAYYPKGTLSIRVPQLVHPQWEDYPTNSWTSSWHTLFANDENDDRKYLGWPGRFLDVSQYAVNFYSTGDEVLELMDDNDVDVWDGITSGWVQYAWQHQELWKGRGIYNILGATTWSGWNIDESWLGVNKISVNEAIAMDARDPAEFKTNTVFYCYPESMNSTNINPLVRAAHLTMGIPALAKPAGSREISYYLDSDDNIDLNKTGNPIDDRGGSLGAVGVSRPNGWPVRSSWSSRWKHSDMKDVSFFYNFKFYQAIIEKGIL